MSGNYMQVGKKKNSPIRKYKLLEKDKVKQIKREIY